MMRLASNRSSMLFAQHKGLGAPVARRTFFSSSRTHQRTQSALPRDFGLQFTSVVSNPREVEAPEGLPSRTSMVKQLDQQEYDLLVIGGGATGAGVALDAANRGYQVACIERGDFSSETSSRSTKLIWAGIKYMGTAFAALLSPKLVTAPISTVKDFYDEMKMVINCHRERTYMMTKNPHLCQWIPIAIPFDTWYATPPPMNSQLYSFFPVLAPMVLKFYDALSLFRCPNSYILTPKSTKTAFPQLDADRLKYVAVFYEALHNDARTNLAIALSAAEHGAKICNYVEMRDVLTNEEGKVVGIVAVDRMTNRAIEIKAKKVVFCGGPFTDELRQMESHGADFPPAVRGAHGTHIVLPGCYCPSNLGLLDYNTSDQRFMFYLPWQGHTLIGTTDAKGRAETLPGPPEEEIDWLLKEASKYLRVDLRRQDVLSAWRGWRPLAADPHAPPDAPVSRDHVISENPKTGTIFIAGGKWTTWREMAQEVVDRALGTDKPCKTLEISLFGGGEECKLMDETRDQLIVKHTVSESLFALLLYKTRY
jgi:glycerol-3-phosphate dehydrogenase